MGRIIDHNELWKLAVRRRFYSDSNEDPGTVWDRRADYHDRSASENMRNTSLDVGLMDLRPDDTVLDVGSGSGRLAVPVAGKVAALTAVDPSARMLMYLRENMSGANLSNCRYVQKRWEDVCLKRDMDPHDVVISAYSMGFYDAAWALDKLHRASKRAVYVFWFGSKRHQGGLLDYISESAGKDYVKKPHFPDYICLLNILHDMGIYANVSIQEYTWTDSFAGVEDAVSKALLTGRITHEEKEYAYEYFRDSLGDDGSGRLVLKTKVNQAMISWLTRDQDYVSSYV